MQQVTEPNLAVKGTLGYCLVYVRDVFSAPWAGSDAWTSWNQYTKIKHVDTLPKGVYVPIWFDGYWKGERLGHVAVYKDGKVWSSPYKSGQNFAVLGSIAETERIYGMKYVGWSEDIGGKIIVKKGDLMSEDDAKVLARLSDHTDWKDEKGWRNWVGKPLTEYWKAVNAPGTVYTKQDDILANKYPAMLKENEQLKKQLSEQKPTQYEEVGNNTGLYQRKK